MKKFCFPTDMRFFQCIVSDFSEKERIALEKDEYIKDVFEIATAKDLFEVIRSQFKGVEKNSLTEYQYAYFNWCYRLSQRADYVIKFVCPVDNSAEGICYQFYVIIDKSEKTQYFIVNFNNFLENCVVLFEDKSVRNLAHRRCMESLRMYEFGKAALLNNRDIIKNTLFLSPGMSLLVIPSDLGDPQLSFWNDCDSKELEDLYKEKIFNPLESLFKETQGCLSHLKKWDFIYLNKDSNGFSSCKMLPSIIGQEKLPGERRDGFLKEGFVETYYTFDSDLPHQVDSFGYYEILETIQVIDEFDFHDSEIVGIVSYDICWPDGTHSWCCKIPVSFTNLLNKFDMYELESKLPLLSKAFYNGMKNCFDKGGVIENNYQEMIYLYDYDQYNKGKANKVHLDCSLWLKDVMYELTKFNHHIELKNIKEGNKNTEKLFDTVKRYGIYNILGGILGG